MYKHSQVKQLMVSFENANLDQQTALLDLQLKIYLTDTDDSSDAIRILCSLKDHFLKMGESPPDQAIEEFQIRTNWFEGVFPEWKANLRALENKLKDQLETQNPESSEVPISL